MKRLLYILTAALMASACGEEKNEVFYTISYPCLLYTSPSPRD